MDILRSPDDVLQMLPNVTQDDLLVATVKTIWRQPTVIKSLNKTCMSHCEHLSRSTNSGRRAALSQGTDFGSSRTGAASGHIPRARPRFYLDALSPKHTPRGSDILLCRNKRSRLVRAVEHLSVALRLIVDGLYPNEAVLILLGSSCYLR